MNVIDFVIIGVLAVSVLFGLYRGFIAGVLNLGGGLVAFLLSFGLYPGLAASIQNNQELQRTLLHYTDASSRIGDLELALTPVADLGREGVAQVLENVQLPSPLDAILRVNLENLVYGTGGAANTVADYVSQTILQASINIICFLICFFGLYVLISVVLNLIRAVFNFPMLKQCDALTGGVFGFFRGMLLCLAAFTLVPLVQTMLPLDFINQLVEESLLAPIFMNGNLITAIMNKKLF
ncbi:MAG: CvpA family protein [Clostridia bacterium]|nr:CvpA family protein [Clostridia bacterium]